FYRLSLIAPIANLVGVPIAGMVLVCSLLGSLFMAIPGFSFCGELLLVVGGWLADTLMLVARFFASIPYASFPYASGWCGLAALLFLAGWVLLYRYRKKWKGLLKSVIAVGLVILLLAAPLVPVYAEDTYEIVVIGSSIDPTIAVIGQNECVVVGCSSVYLLYTVLSSRQVGTIDCLILPTHNTYGDSVRELCDTIAVEKIATSTANVQQGLVSFANPSILSNELAVSVGDVTVNTNEAFATFVITVGSEQVVYETKKETALLGTTIVTQSPTNKSTLITYKNTTYVVNDLLVFKINEQGTRIYRPRFIYG
ncbi:MAG: ComEC/Rec2 family competence protein, partial [Clostridia bacterium]|nr:ComEC/Rec2 family competence protein [Clostridia bacterium]